MGKILWIILIIILLALGWFFLFNNGNDSSLENNINSNEKIIDITGVSDLEVTDDSLINDAIDEVDDIEIGDVI